MINIILGGNGFVGKAICRKFVELNENFLVLDNLFVEKHIDYPSNFKKFDLETDDIFTFLQQFEGNFNLINLAAVHHIPTCESNPKLSFLINTFAAIRVVQACIKHSCNKIIFASSGAVYEPSLDIHNENSKICGIDVYSTTKLQTEMFINTLVGNKSLPPTSILRFFNIVGEGDYTKHLLPDIAEQINKADGDEILLGNIQRERNYVHVEDVANSIILLLSKSELNGNVNTFNVCSDGYKSVLEILGYVAEAIGKPLNYRSVDSRKRPNDRERQYGSYHALKEYCGWHPKKTVKEGVFEYINWLMKLKK